MIAISSTVATVLLIDNILRKGRLTSLFTRSLHLGDKGSRQISMRLGSNRNYTITIESLHTMHSCSGSTIRVLVLETTNCIREDRGVET